MNNEPTLKNLYVIEQIDVYDDESDEPVFSVMPHETIQGMYDGLLGGYLCTHSTGQKYLALYHEVLVC